jgi:hypothetical protein
MAEDLNGFLLEHDPAFSAQSLAQWMREQFAVEMRRERLILDEQQKVTREALAVALPSTSGDKATVQGRAVQKSGPKMPAAPVTGPTANGKGPAMPMTLSQDVPLDDLDGDADFNEKTTVSIPQFVDSGRSAALPEQSTRILDGAQAPPPPAQDLPAAATVVFDNVPPLPGPMEGQPFVGAVDQSVLYPPREPYTPQYGRLPPPPPRARSTVWKDIVIGVAVAAAVVGGVLGARAYVARRGQATMVVVSPSGSGDLLIDGTPRGQLAAATPMTLKSLAAGEHQVLVRSDAGEFRQVVTLIPGDVTVVNISFAGGATGKLKLEIEAPGSNGTYAPSRADVYVDGAQLGPEASATPISLRADTKHEVRVQKPGMAEQHFGVEIRAGETVVRPVRLTPAGGKLLIASDPAGAEVLVNGHRMGITPLTVNDLDPTRTAHVLLHVAGYQSAARNVSFEHGLDQTIEVHLVAGKDGKEPDVDAVAKNDPDPPKSEAKSESKSESRFEKSEPKSSKVAKHDERGKEHEDKPKETPVPPRTADNHALPSDGLAPINFGSDKPDKSGSASEPGYLVANTQPWAKVFIDGKDTGKTTPISARSKLLLKPGKHTVTFVVSGKKYNYDISVKPGAEVQLIKQLTESGQ